MARIRPKSLLFRRKRAMFHALSKPNRPELRQHSVNTSCPFVDSFVDSPVRRRESEGRLDGRYGALHRRYRAGSIRKPCLVVSLPARCVSEGGHLSKPNFLSSAA